jgi:hypothetical protein
MENNNEERLKEPDMPDVKVPEGFLKKVLENRTNYEKIKRKIRQQKEKG